MPNSTHIAEHRVLVELWGITESYTFTELHELVCRRESWISVEALGDVLATLVERGWIRLHAGADSSVPRYSITQRGKARWAADEAREVFSTPVKPRIEEAPVEAAVCNRKDPPPTAVICLDEDELDDWWANLDVENKADAFARYALHQETSYVAVDAQVSTIPVMGTIGGDNAKLQERIRQAVS